MSDDTIRHLLSRMDRIEAMFGSNNSVGWSDVRAVEERVKALEEHVTKRFEIVNNAREKQIKLLVEQINLCPDMPSVAAHVTKMLEAFADGAAEHSLTLEEELRSEIEDSARALRSDVSKAEAAAASSIKHAAQILGQYASELGS